MHAYEWVTLIIRMNATIGVWIFITVIYSRWICIFSYVCKFLYTYSDMWMPTKEWCVWHDRMRQYASASSSLLFTRIEHACLHIYGDLCIDIVTYACEWKSHVHAIYERDTMRLHLHLCYSLALNIHIYKYVYILCIVIYGHICMPMDESRIPHIPMRR